ncbi:hypothetical protein A2U01_0096249, partial [Trifolium medium]|nr:hypothetical protein [Trifolium medium]
SEDLAFQITPLSITESSDDDDKPKAPKVPEIVVLDTEGPLEIVVHGPYSREDEAGSGDDRSIYLECDEDEGSEKKKKK